MRIFPRNFASLAIGIFISFTTFASAATLLPLDEVAALKEIGKTLGKTDWDFSADPCTFSTERNLYGFEDSVTCNPCNDTVCHITRMSLSLSYSVSWTEWIQSNLVLSLDKDRDDPSALKTQDLQGTLPSELVRLTHLEDIDLSRNYLNGTIPPEWGSMKLVNISLLGNRLTGPIPKEFGNMSTLESLSLEFNQLSGPIPPELGSLPRLWKLVEEEESFRKVVSENSFIDLDSETWEKDEVTAQNNDPKNGFVDVEKSKEEVEASKAKNSEESAVHGEGNKCVEDDQLSQIPKEGHISKVETDKECNEESSVHGLKSWVEDSAGPFFVTSKDQSKEIKDQCDYDQRLEIPVSNVQVHNGDRSITLMNEPTVIDSKNNLRACQMEGINLVVDLKPADLRKRIRSQSFEDCMSSGESEFVQNSCSSRGTRQGQEEIDAELQLTTNVGKRLGVKITERDVQMMKKMIEMEVFHSYSLCTMLFVHCLFSILGSSIKSTNSVLMHLTSNYFTGELPKELAKLITLKDFRIGSNNFIGKIPDFIQNWVDLTRLDIQGSGLDGPIPPGIGLLTKLSDLRISDLNGSQASFPPLNNLTSLKNLFLRSCNINGTLPEYLGTMTKLKILDLSFNNMSGEIPSNFIDRTTIEMMYLTGNLLSGPVPNWMLQTSTNIYPHEIPPIISFYHRVIFHITTLAWVHPKIANKGIRTCLEALQGAISRKFLNLDHEWSSFHINCGGKEVSIDGNKYERDRDEIGPSNYYRSTTNWAFSSTGNFMDDHRTDDPSISTSSSRLSVNNSELYVDARISPISLTYYGFCLVKGNYNIALHFAEIMFNDGKSYSSLGRRIFDIYIQGKWVQKDFNIEDEAGGIGKEVIKNYTANVTDGTLEIRFYWARKGTTGLPTRGVYGPLISAISVDNPGDELRKLLPLCKAKTSYIISFVFLFSILHADYEPPKGIPVGTVVGIVAAAAFVIILLLDLKGLDLQTGSFTLRQIKATKNNFDEANKIGEGSFGSVYKVSYRTYSDYSPVLNRHI
ncbi:hypothetical protein RHGRI_009819 [Rhododendron griersonianum]|uniref:non-specific serine/threonine protein kinase n=1 Tax=Rhododendron griersonianum TaxID=479676 RepID=A0AAV6KG67_9ERIC|nr:hypothetical protein RHGRI_009819 [Rhododendron griersonianum]KAG5551530.1 hypothetical protein RHGRI_009819 [Rhododendron griersonianum]